MEKRSPTYSAFACGVKNENDHCPNSSPFHSTTISPGSKLQPHQKHIKSEPTDSITNSVGKPLTNNRKPSIHTNDDDNETKEQIVKTEASDISAVPLKKDASSGMNNTKKNNEDPTKRAVISQEETDQAVTALLGESFENSFDSSNTDLIGGARIADRHHSGSSSIIDDANIVNIPSDPHKATGVVGVSSDIGNTNSDSNMVDQNETQSAVAGIVDDSDEAAAAVAGLAQEMSPTADAMYSLQSSPASAVAPMDSVAGTPNKSDKNVQNEALNVHSDMKNNMVQKGKEE